MFASGLVLLLLNAVTALQPPVRIGGPDSLGRTRLRIEVKNGLALTLLEAGAAEQAMLVDKALESGASAIDEDPYGVVLWPAAQVVAHYLVSSLELSGRRVVELGAGTGLCSLAAAASGASCLATDYRMEPLALLKAAAELSALDLGLNFDLQTRFFDVMSEEALPQCDVLVAADLLYLRPTSEALASRCVEALRHGCTDVVVGDAGRPGRAAFLQKLKAEGVRAKRAQFQAVAGWSAGTHRHELFSTEDMGRPASISVGLMHLTCKDLPDEH